MTALRKVTPPNLPFEGEELETAQEPLNWMRRLSVMY